MRNGKHKQPVCTLERHVSEYGECMKMWAFTSPAPGSLPKATSSVAQQYTQCLQLLQGD